MRHRDWIRQTHALRCIAEETGWLRPYGNQETGFEFIRVGKYALRGKQVRARRESTAEIQSTVIFGLSPSVLAGLSLERKGWNGNQSQSIIHYGTCRVCTVRLQNPSSRGGGRRTGILEIDIRRSTMIARAGNST